MKPETERSLEKARLCLEHARGILAIGLGEDAGRAAYLAGFHAAQAVIFERTGRSAKTHQGVKTQFLKLVSSDAGFPLTLRPFLSRAYNLKTVADYETGPSAVVPLEQARQAIATAEQFLAAITQLLAE